MTEEKSGRYILLKLNNDSTYTLEINKTEINGKFTIERDTLFVEECEFDGNEVNCFVKRGNKSILAIIDKSSNSKGSGLLLSKGKNGRATF